MPGEVYEGHLRLSSAQNYSTKNLPFLNVFWIHDNYINYIINYELYTNYSIHYNPPYFKVTQGIVCYHIFTSSLYPQIARYVLRSARRELTKSWNEASELCRKIDAHLPVFKGREDLREFIFFLKKFYFVIPPIEGLYIGLKIYLNQVSLNNTFHRPSARTNTREQLLSPPEVKELML